MPLGGTLARATSRSRRGLSHGGPPISAAALAGLISRARLGDVEAFASLVEVTSVEVYALALRLVGNEHDARDVVQETYLRAFRAIGRFRGDAAITTWLYRICANCATDHLTRRGRRKDEPLDVDLAVVDLRGDTNPEAALALTHERAELVRQLSRLPYAMRAVVVLRDIYDLPHEAIAAELGISKTAAKVRLHRARRLLREQLYAAAPDGGETSSRSLRVRGDGGRAAL